MVPCSVLGTRRMLASQRYWPPTSVSGLSGIPSVQWEQSAVKIMLMSWLVSPSTFLAPAALPQASLLRIYAAVSLSLVRSLRRSSNRRSFLLGVV